VTLFGKSSDQAQQFLLFGACTPAQEDRDFDMLHVPARSHISLEADEHSA